MGKSMDSHENHGAWSGSKIPWFSWGFSHVSMGPENCKNIPHENMGSIGYKTIENHGKHDKHGNLQKGKHGKHGIFQYITFNIFRKHGKHVKIAWERMGKHGIYAN